MPANTYAWQPEPPRHRRVKAVLVSFDFRQTDCETVGWFAQVVSNNLEWLTKNGHPKWKSVSLEDIRGNHGCPLLAAPDTCGNGSTWDADLSPAMQTFLYNADGENNHVRMWLSDSGRILASFGRSGWQAGEFPRVHTMAVESKGNIYTIEVDNAKRAQKFVASSKGYAPRHGYSQTCDCVF
jgi:hypothetical protein